MSDVISSLIEHSLTLLNPLKPRFYISISSARCRERVQRVGSGNPLIMLRADVENFGLKQSAPPPCEVHLVKIRHNDRPIENEASRLKWTDVDSFDGQKIIRSKLIDICSIDKSDQPTLAVESEKGRQGYGFFRDAGIYKFDLTTVCKGSSPGRATITVSFDGTYWENVHFVSIKSRMKWWRHWVLDFILLLIVLCIGYSYFVINEEKIFTSDQSHLVDPVINVALGEPFGSRTVVSVRNSGIVSIVDVAMNLRCFVLPLDKSLSPMLFFEGFRALANKNSWWVIDKITPGNTFSKDAKESLARCIYNSKLTEKSPMQFVIRERIFAVDITYRRESDHKEYAESRIAHLMENSSTGEPFLGPIPMSEQYRLLLEKLPAPNFSTEPK